ncbi:co-chaperone GroES [Kineosporia mesophila]|uniref:10 kDa chaperonin n=2 Tax=Kineosporia mesophila TaxID=566012 RepID=A0ABP6YZN2_9ACTN|nr:co-chaperone GroES [Kineosporia mesophila]
MSSFSTEVPSGSTPGSTNKLPIRMLNDRLLVSVDKEAGERRSSAGIVIPATASVGRRLAWSAVVAIGQHVRQVQIGDRVLYDPEDLSEVELHGEQYILLRERDIHAVAAPRVEDDRTGPYL